MYKSDYIPGFQAVLSSQIKISISKDSPVAIRDQLIEQIGLQIASATLKPKDKLPSIRALAQKLGIHHSTVTAAYNHLAEAGLLEIRQGSGVRVASNGLSAGSDEKEDDDINYKSIFKQFIAKAAEQGISRQEILEFVKTALEAKPLKRVLVVDRNLDFHPILLAELEESLSLPIEPITYNELSQQKHLLNDSFIVTSFYHLYPLQNLELDPTRFILCTVEPGQQEMEAVKSLKAGSLLAFVSVSPTLLKMATNMVAALRGEDIAVRTLTATETSELSYLSKHLDLIICDKPSEKIVRSLVNKVPVLAFRLYSETTKQLIKDRLKNWF